MKMITNLISKRIKKLFIKIKKQQKERGNMFYKCVLKKENAYYHVPNIGIFNCLFVEADSYEEAINLVQQKYALANSEPEPEDEHSPINLELQTAMVGVYDDIYDDTIKEWFDRYGKYEIVEPPTYKVNTNSGFKIYIGVIRFRSIEEYVEFLVQYTDFDFPAARTGIVYKDGTVKRLEKLG